MFMRYLGGGIGHKVLREILRIEDAAANIVPKNDLTRVCRDINPDDFANAYHGANDPFWLLDEDEDVEMLETGVETVQQSLASFNLEAYDEDEEDEDAEDEEEDEDEGEDGDDEGSVESNGGWRVDEWDSDGSESDGGED